MKIRMVVLSLVLVAATANNASGFTSYPSIDVTLVSPKIALRGSSNQESGRLSVKDPGRPVTYTMALTNTGNKALYNVQLLFNPNPKGGVVIATPKAQRVCIRAYCKTRWVIKRFPSHERRLFTVKVTYAPSPTPYESKQQFYVNGYPKGDNTLFGVVSEVVLVLNIAASAETTTTSPTATSTTTTMPTTTASP